MQLGSKTYNAGLRGFFLVSVLAVAVGAVAQDRCGVVEYTEQLRSKKKQLESNTHFEEWLNGKVAQRKAGRTESLVYQVPVVVHVIHKGEALGTGVNISDGQIASQINVLNNDYARLNADAGNTPTEFLSVAAGFKLEFILAKQDPNGAATTGVVRVKGSKNQWSMSDNSTLKSLSYWPAEDYLNIWVTDLSSTLLGYAQFPVSSGLAGLEDEDNNRLTDGVVIDYLAFGSRDDGSFSLSSAYNKGRTATHEVGHFLGLRHIWGDDNGACGGSGDYVSDTPDQGKESSGCPSHPQTSCSVHTMFQNYMDYTNDACMNLFTQGQVDRMITVLENSPRRVSLLTSVGLSDPAPKPNNTGIVSIQSPAANQCRAAFLPTLTVKNAGTNDVSSVAIQLTMDGATVETKTIMFAPALAPAATASVTLSSRTLSSGSHALVFNITSTNGTTDSKADDNTSRITTFVPYDVAVPYTETFTTLPASWPVKNADDATTWSLATAPRDVSSNTAVYVNFYDYDNTLGATDIITSPVFSLAETSSPYLMFDVAYTTYKDSDDKLQVYVVSECATDLSQGTQVYYKHGSTLATTATITSSFVPSGVGDWRREVVDLSAFAGQSNLQLAFVTVNDWGNNLYLDNVAVVKSLSENITLVAVESPAPVQCTTDAEPVLRVKNSGSVVIHSFRINYSLNSGAVISRLVNETLAPGESRSITLPQQTLVEGSNTFSFVLAEPNELGDIDASDNNATHTVLVNTATASIPLRENFDGDYTAEWSVVNPQGGMKWLAVGTNYNQSMYFNAYANTEQGDESWLVSPSLDFTGATTASMFFDLSYRYNTSGVDRSIGKDYLRVLGSSDCGVTYSEILFDKRGDSLSVLSQSQSWLPAKASDWERVYLNLTEFAGKESVRIAFVFANGYNNNIYLDNIEFFVSDNPTPILAEQPFAVYGTDPSSPRDFYITFNLDSRQSVAYELVDMMGRSVAQEELTDVLNQTYRVDAGTETGVYVLRLLISGKSYATRVYVGR